MAANKSVKDKQLGKRVGGWKKEKKKYKTNASMSEKSKSTGKANHKTNNSNPIRKSKDKRRYFKVPKLADKPLINTKVALPSTAEEFSVNWKQISQIINQKNSSSSAKENKESIKEQPQKQSADSSKPLSQVEKSKLKRKLKREKAKLGKKDKKDKLKSKTKNKKSNEKSDELSKKNDLWFEVDNIYLDRVVNPGGEAVPASDDNLVKSNTPTGPTPAIAIDCEMVGVGVSKRSALARVSIVNQFGHCIYDKFVKPEEPITDYRTFVSGIRPRDLVNGAHIDIVRQEVAELFKGRIVVGHSIMNDLQALFLRHPKRDIRDTSHYFKRHFAGHVPSLKRLAETLLNIKVQSGEHSSVEDAQATMRLYTLYKKDWEASLGNKAKKQQFRSKNKEDKTSKSTEEQTTG